MVIRRSLFGVGSGRRGYKLGEGSLVRRPTAILGSFIFLLLAPGIVMGVVPWWISHWQMRPSLLGLSGFRILGVLLIAIGAPILLDSFARFAIQGLGTPAPVLPTRHLVVTGMYRFVRNPMYLGGAAMIFGQALLFGDVRLFGYGLLVWLASHLFVVGYEEPKLRKTFGEEYLEFSRNVPRWIPRLKPWNPR
jgi:protein-S-isoprenylcysteine O-methyltransferase Ste14